MKALVLLERWKEDDKLIRKNKFTMFTYGLQTALYVFENKGLPLNLNELLISKPKYIEKVDTKKIIGDISKDLFKDSNNLNNNNLNLYNNINNNNNLKSRDRDSQPREVIFSKKVSTKADNSKERDISPYNRSNKETKNIKKSSSNKETFNFKTVKKGNIDIPKLDLNVIKPKENEKKLVQSKSFVNEYSNSIINSNLSKINSSHSNDNVKSLNKSFCEDRPKYNLKTKGNYLKVKPNSMKDKPYNKIINCARTPEPAVRTEKLNQLKKDSSDKKMKQMKNDSRLMSSDKKSIKEGADSGMVKSKMVENNIGFKEGMDFKEGK